MKVGSHWMLVREGAANNKIVIDTFDDSSGAFTAHYYAIDNPSKFHGIVHHRERSLMSMDQDDAANGYHSAHLAVRDSGDPNSQQSWIGTWGDVTGKKVRKFEMNHISVE